MYAWHDLPHKSGANASDVALNAWDCLQMVRASSDSIVHGRSGVGVAITCRHLTGWPTERKFRSSLM